jgi:spore coat polysaccharide biosynthesis protein SpsF
MYHGKIGIILQARMGSTRLPGKVLKPLAGKPMLQWIIERLQKCANADTLILATTTLAQDQPLVALAETLGIEVFRGSEADVLDRYYQCALVHHLDHVIRATGDNPFVDPEACDRLVAFYLSQQMDYATVSTEREDGYPLGVGLEVLSFAALERSWREGHAPHHREHVNEYILENPGIFAQARMPAPTALYAPELSLTVDTPEQFAWAEAAYADYYSQCPSQLMPVTWAIRLYRRLGRT